MNIPDTEVLQEDDPARMKKIHDGPRDIRTTFRDENSAIIFEKADLAATNYQHLPDIVVHRWPSVKHIVTSTMGAGCPIRLVEIKRPMKDTLAQCIPDEGENNLHSKREEEEGAEEESDYNKKKKE